LIFVHLRSENDARAAEAAKSGRISEVPSDGEHESSDEEEHLTREPRNGCRSSERTPLLVDASPWAEERGERERQREVVQ